MIFTQRGLHFVLGGACLLVSAFNVPTAQAATLYWDYFTNGQPAFNINGTPVWNSGFLLSGSMSGTLGADGNTFTPTAIITVGLNNSTQSIQAPIIAPFRGEDGPVVTLDGSDLMLVIAYGNQPIQYLNTANFQYWSVDGLGGGTFLQSGWLANLNGPITGVPEPMSIILLGTGVLAAGALRRRRP